MNVAADALWFATSDSIPGMVLPADISHPHRIRQWFNEQQAANTPDPFEVPEEAMGIAGARWCQQEA